MKDDQFFCSITIDNADYSSPKFGEFFWVNSDSGNEVVIAVSFFRSSSSKDVNLYKLIDHGELSHTDFWLYKESVMPIAKDSTGFFPRVYDKTSFNNGRIVNANYH